jgi:hypothetical protein
MNDQDISVTSVFLNILATLGFIFFARTPPQTTADIEWASPLRPLLLSVPISVLHHRKPQRSGAVDEQSATMIPSSAM